MTSCDIWAMDASTVVRCIYYVHLHVYLYVCEASHQSFCFFLTRSAVQIYVFSYISVMYFSSCPNI